MSIKIMSNVWDTSQSDGPQLLVELALADFADDDGKCYPAVSTLARKARCSETTVHVVIRRLQKEKRLKVETEASEYGTNIFTWAHDGRFDNKGHQGGASDAPPAPGDTPGVRPTPLEGVRPGGVRRAPDPPMIRNRREPPAEPSKDRATHSTARRADDPLSRDPGNFENESSVRAPGAGVDDQEGEGKRLIAFAQALQQQCRPEEIRELALGEEGGAFVLIGGPKSAIDALRASRLVQIAGAARTIGYQGVKYSAGDG